MDAPRRLKSRRRPVAVIGWNEYVDLPDWGIRGIRAKIDTGARSSALHVENVEELSRDRVRFDVVLDRDGPERTIHVTAAVARRARVKSSTGHMRRRIFVTTTVRIGSMNREVELSLVDRETMIYRMLVGRTALGGRYLIDSGGQCLHGRPPRQGRTRS